MYVWVHARARVSVCAKIYKQVIHMITKKSS